MSLFKPQTARGIARTLNKIIASWDIRTPEEKASGEFINPDESVVLSVPNPEWEGEDDDCGEDGYGESRKISFHVESVGGGADCDEDGTECGHEGFEIGGMEMNYDKFLSNGRRRPAK